MLCLRAGSHLPCRPRREFPPLWRVNEDVYILRRCGRRLHKPRHRGGSEEGHDQGSGCGVQGMTDADMDKITAGGGPDHTVYLPGQAYYGEGSGRKFQWELPFP